MHYDFRLELDGVLKSWAIPKGPSMDPSTKRLAMQVEDHPLEYGGFEGTIPKGNYGAGEVRIWDRGFYHSSHAAAQEPQENLKQLREGLAKGHLDIVLYGDKLQGRFSLVKIKSAETKKDNAWLFIKHTDEGASPTKASPMPHQVQPMLAKLVEKPFDRAGWFFEVKWDGYRAIAEVDDQKVTLYSRNGLSFDSKYPSIVEALHVIKHQVVLDGEIVAITNGKPDFHALQNQGEQPASLQYLVFDLLYLDGRDLRNAPLRERKELLKDLLPRNPTLLLSEYVEGTGIAFYKQIEKMGLEGVVGKDTESRYEEGRRTGSWVKMKAINEQEALVVGFTAPRGSRKKLGSLLLGLREGDKIRFVGHSGGGFTDKELESIYDRLKKIEVPDSPFQEKIEVNAPVTWVKPELVCQIKFTEWTKDGRMRQPIFAGLREDKPASEVVKESPAPLPHPHTGVKLTNLQKVFWPKEGYTKGDVIGYYDALTDTILPHLKDRPESLRRQPNGIADEGFFHKDMTTQLPSFVETTRVYSETNEKTLTYILCQNRETLLYLANLGCIELNPWLSRIGQPDRPDFSIVDLDPGEAPFEDLIVTAQAVHKVLKEAHIDSYCKTSGKSGLHIAIPLGGACDFDQSRMLAELIVRLTHQQLPKLTSIDRNPGNRGGKVYLDHLQNRRGQTIAAPYSLRPCPGATVSTPLAWEEVESGLKPKAFTIETTLKRVEALGDLWKPVLTESFDLAKALENLRGDP